MIASANTLETKIDDFLSQKRIAVVGVSRNKSNHPAGNLIYRRTARNFNPMCAMAGKITVAEVEEIVEVGELDPDASHTPGIFVQRIVLNAHPEKRIEQRVVRAKGD